MPAINRTAVTLRIFGDDLDPAEITNLLGCKPTDRQLKDQKILRNGSVRVAKTGMWNLCAECCEPGNLNHQIAELLSLTNDDISLWSELGSKYKIDIFCGLFMEGDMEGIDIAHEILLELGRRRIKLDFDIYGPDEE